ncbi:hypothetical protein QE152_g10479 [Popillia japonica]|uniref:Uncharacterized protein n=1 Tax=Popillia japonica TaxID=7064 RepID=A0AAW1LTP8_POPJA
MLREEIFNLFEVSLTGGGYIPSSIIFDESSSEASEEDFKDFMIIFARKKTGRRDLNYSRGSDSEDFDGIKVIGDTMHCRASSASSKNASTCLYPCEFYRKSKVTKRESKPQNMYMHGVSYYGDISYNQYKYRNNRPRSLSPNLPKIHYLEKPHHSVPPPPSTQRKARIVFKNRLCRENQKLNKNVSKKSIPDHALMKNLLSGLSIFENDEEVRETYSKSLHKSHKSMGNIKSSIINNSILRGACKSNSDFRESTIANSEGTWDNKCCYANNKEGYSAIYRNEAADQLNTPNTYCCVDSQRHAKNNEEGDAGYRRQIRSNQAPQRCSTLVERRKNFFENRKKQIELENIKMKPTIVISCVERQIQNDFEKSDEITEIYRNFRSVQSTSTLSKRSSSLPPTSRFRRCAGRNSELFNPDYNFNCGNDSSNPLYKNSIIESIRSKIFNEMTVVIRCIRIPLLRVYDRKFSMRMRIRSRNVTIPAAQIFAIYQNFPEKPEPQCPSY